MLAGSFGISSAEEDGTISSELRQARPRLRLPELPVAAPTAAAPLLRRRVGEAGDLTSRTLGAGAFLLRAGEGPARRLLRRGIVGQEFEVESRVFSRRYIIVSEFDYVFVPG